MIPEEKISVEAEELLKKIKYEYLRTPENQPDKEENIIRRSGHIFIIEPKGTKFWLSPSDVEGQKNLIYIFQERGILEILQEEEDADLGYEDVFFVVKVIQPNFNNFYKQWEYVKENPWISETERPIELVNFLKGGKPVKIVSPEEIIIKNIKKNPIKKEIDRRLEKARDKDEIKEEIIKDLKETEIQTGKPYTVVKKGKGYLKFYKEGENIEIGKPNTRHFRLLQCLSEPQFGIQKTTEAVFEAIKLPKDKNNSDLSDWSPQRKTKILTLIEYTKKELQKNKQLQRKIRYKFDDRKNNMWLELED